MDSTRTDDDKPTSGTVTSATQPEPAHSAKDQDGGKSEKLSEAERAAIEEDTLRRRFGAPQKIATTSPPVSANEPPRPTLEEVLSDMKYPATKGDVLIRARGRGMHLDERYAIERIEDRMYLDFEDVERGIRA